MSAAEWIAQRRELLDAATEGPWESDGSEISQHWSRPEPWKMVASSEVVCGSYCYGGAGRGIEHAPDAEFIADARTSLPAALDALEAVLDLARQWEGSPDLLPASLRPYTRSERLRAAIEAALRGES